MPQKLTINELYSLLEAEVSKYSLPLIERVFLDTKSPYLTAVASILTTRTPDKLTEKRLPAIFAYLKTPEDGARANINKLAQLIYPIGFYKIKAKSIIKFSQMILDKHEGNVPPGLTQLLELPGIGRKVANLIQSVVFDIPAICVDTHVHRIMNHIGYVKTKTPEETELKLRKKLPKELWNKTNRIFVVLGQTTCGVHDINKPECILNRYLLRKN